MTGRAARPKRKETPGDLATVGMTKGTDHSIGNPRGHSGVLHFPRSYQQLNGASHLGPVVQRVDNFIQRINPYPVDKTDLLSFFFPVGRGTLLQVSPITAGPL